MSIELVARAKKIRLGGDSTAKLLLIVLADYANDEGMAWPSVRTLTDEVEKQDRQIQRALRKLEDMGLIRLGDQRLTRNYPKGQRPTVYEVLPTPRPRPRKAKFMHDAPTGDVHDTPTPVTHDTTPVTHMTPPRCHARRGTGVTHDTQTVIETTNKPSRESTRAKTPTTRPPASRLRALAGLTPDSEHRALADGAGLDVDGELAKFRDRCLAEGRYPADPAAAFRNWLRRGRELNLGKPSRPDAPATQAADLERRARKLLDSSTPLKRRRPAAAQRERWLPAVTCMLARGMNPVDVVNLLLEGDPEQFAALGIPVDDLDSVA